MKLKNITDSVREFRDDGRVISLKPGEEIAVNRPRFNETCFKLIKDEPKIINNIHIEKKAEKVEKENPNLVRRKTKSKRKNR